LPAKRAGMAALVGRALLAAAAWGVLAGLAVALPVTALDWYANPSGLFHGEDGTRWPIVWETAWSWFWPVAGAAAAVVAPVQAWWRLRARPAPRAG